MVFRLLGEGVKWYHSKLKMNPLRTQLITGTLLTTTGDVICQLAVEKKGLFDDYDWIRSCRMGCFSMTVWVPVGYYWFGYAAKAFPGAGWNLVKKVAIDQLFVIPCLLINFLTFNELLQGHTFETLKKRVSDDYFNILQKNWSIWTPVQIINFYLIPLLYQVIFVRVVSFFWNIYLSWRAHL